MSTADAGTAVTAVAVLTSPPSSASDHQVQHFVSSFHSNNNNNINNKIHAEEEDSMTTTAGQEDLTDGGVIVTTGCVSDLPPTPAATPSNVSDIVEEEILTLDQLRILMTKGHIMGLTDGTTILTPSDLTQDHRPQSTSSCPSEEMDIMPLTSGSLSDCLSGHPMSSSSPDHESIISSNESTIGVMVSVDHGPEDQVRSLTVVSRSESPDVRQSFSSSPSSLVFRDHGFVCRIKQESQERDDDGVDERTETLIHGSGTQQVECKTEPLVDDKSATRAMILRQRLQQPGDRESGGDDPQADEFVDMGVRDEDEPPVAKKRRLSSSSSSAVILTTTTAAATEVPHHPDPDLLSDDHHPHQETGAGAESKERSRSGASIPGIPSATTASSATCGSPPKVTDVLVQTTQQKQETSSSVPVVAATTTTPPVKLSGKSSSSTKGSS